MSRSTIIFAVGVILCAASLLYLQQRFDRSDHAKATRLVRNFRVESRPERFEEFLMRRHGGLEGAWSTEITGGCRGVVRVTWSVPGHPPTVYFWDVEIPSQKIHPNPASPQGEQILREFVGEVTPLPPLDLPPLDGGR